MKWHGTYGRGVRRRIPGKMNKLEEAYSYHLKELVHRNEIVWWVYEGVTLKIGVDSRYTPDFFVMKSDGAIEVHETKGRWLANGRTKIKVAASLYPFRFLGVTKSKDGWAFEEFLPSV